MNVERRSGGQASTFLPGDNLYNRISDSNTDSFCRLAWSSSDGWLCRGYSGRASCREEIDYGRALGKCYQGGRMGRPEAIERPGQASVWCEANLSVGRLVVGNHTAFPAFCGFGLVYAKTWTYALDMLKKELPVTHCTQCGAAGYNSRVADRRCCKTIAGERCNGTNETAVNRGNWDDCPFCEATGYYRNKECPQCRGVGYLFVSTGEKQAVS